MIFISFDLFVHISAHGKVYAGLTLTNNETQYCGNIRVLHGFLVAVVPFMLHIDICSEFLHWLPQEFKRPVI